MDAIKALTAKALEWVQANDSALLAGSLPLYHHLAKKHGVPPAWTPGDADVWVFAPHTADCDDLFQVKGPDTDQLRFGGLVRANGMPVISTVRYPFGNVQIIVMSPHLEWACAPRVAVGPSTVLDSFDHTACMIGMTTPDTFVYGTRFNVDEPVMIERVSRLPGFEVPYQERVRFQQRMEKYRSRDLAPLAITQGYVDEDIWLKCYICEGRPIVANLIADATNDDNDLS
jgi:hypothetical protein